MGNTCNACDYQDENRVKDINTTKQRHLKLHTNIDMTPKNRKNEILDNVNDSDLTSPHRPTKAQKVNEMNQISERAIKVEDNKGRFRVRYMDDNINNGAPVLGPYRYEKGETYLGQYHNGMRHGKGRMVWPDGTVYEGQWISNKRHGKGRVIYAQGDYYEGNLFFKLLLFLKNIDFFCFF